MRKTFFVISSVCVLLCSVSAAPATDNSVDEFETSAAKVPEADYKPAQAVIEAIYQKAMVNAIQNKVLELQQKLARGENSIPAAVDLLKITLLSTPTQDTIRKAAEQVINFILPEEKKSFPYVAESSTNSAAGQPSILNSST